jgi:hypothetical protein
MPLSRIPRPPTIKVSSTHEPSVVASSPPTLKMSDLEQRYRDGEMPDPHEDETPPGRSGD